MSEIAKHIETVAKALLGEPNLKLSTKSQLRWGNHGSMSVDLVKGTWFDHECDQGGGVADLIKRDNPLAHIPDVLTSLGIETEQPQLNGHDTIRTSLVKTYSYCDEHGEVTYEVCRFEPKTFKQRRVVDGRTIWGLGDTIPLPYRLPDIINNPTKPIMVCEGEKDADNLAELGFVATCNSGGAGKWAESLNQWFQGRDIVILPDNDKAGESHISAVISNLQGKANRIKVVKLPVKEKGDVTDWLNQGGEKSTLLALIKEAEVWTEPVIHTPLPFLDLKQIAKLPPVEWLIDGLIPEKSLAMMYGEPGCGKTFLALDMALSIAHGHAWQGSPGLQGNVVYVAGEGVGGLKKRVAAWHLHNELDQQAPFIVIPVAVDLMDEINAQELQQTIETAAPGKTSLVVFDTVARSMSGDENSSQDMGKVVKAMDHIREAFNCCVLAIHHSGKDSSRGARGSSSMLGAVDASMRVERMGETVSLTVEKQKDAEMQDPIWFNTVSVEVETDALGLEADTSLVFTRTTQAPINNGKAMKPATKAVYDALLDAIITHGKPSPGGEHYPAGVQVIEERQWRETALNKTISTGNADAERKAFSRAAKQIQDKNLVGKWDKYVWRVR